MHILEMLQIGFADRQLLIYHTVFIRTNVNLNLSADGVGLSAVTYVFFTLPEAPFGLWEQMPFGSLAENS